MWVDGVFINSRRVDNVMFNNIISIVYLLPTFLFFTLLTIIAMTKFTLFKSISVFLTKFVNFILQYTWFSGGFFNKF